MDAASPADPAGPPPVKLLARKLPYGDVLLDGAAVNDVLAIAGLVGALTPPAYR